MIGFSAYLRLFCECDDVSFVVFYFLIGFCGYLLFLCVMLKVLQYFAF